MESNIFDFTKENGLVFCNTPDEAKNKAEFLYIHEAGKLGADAIFFRRFYRENEPVPYHSEPSVCIFQKEDSFFNSQEHIELHAALWSSGKNDIYIINCSTRLDIISAREPAKVDQDKNVTINKLISTVSKALKEYKDQRFSAYLFETGTFWEQAEFKNKIDEKNNPHIYLLDRIMEVREIFFNETEIKLIPSTIDKLLIICILIKFLEEKKDELGHHPLRDIYSKNNIISIANALEKNVLITILKDLATEFNGKIFDKFTTEEQLEIQHTDLSLIAQFLNGNIDLVSKQLFIWEQYSFKHLPVEVISSIYENFIQHEAIRQTGEKEKGVVYTPIHLVNFLVDEVMPLNKPELFKDETFKILDPSCGSGVFLVSAYKRLLQWWTINNSKPGDIRYPQSKEAQKILEENIFGVDVKEGATLVTVFSLTIALLDKLTPQEIWENLEFKDLSQNNIKTHNFFEWAVSAMKEEVSFDLIIGNPPFNIESGKEKKSVLAPVDQLKLSHSNIPLNDFALHFFETAMLFTQKSCLILRSNVFLYSKESQDYRTEVFTDFTVNRIYDFTHVRRILFHKKADTPVLALIVEKTPSKKQPIEHIIIKRTVSVEKKLGFEIDYYDRHIVNWNWATEKSMQFIWKTNLLGGGQLFHLIYRLSLLETLGGFIKDKETRNNWNFNIGYIVGNENQLKKAPYITNQDSIKKISNDQKIEVEIETSVSFEATREENLYIPPFIILKNSICNECIPINIIEKYKHKYLAFKRIYIGISAPKQDLNELKKIHDFIKIKYAKLCQLYILACSASILILLETRFNKEDIDFLPFPENEEYLKLSDPEQILQDDVLNYYIHLGKAISGDGKALNEMVGEDKLLQFGNTFCKALNDRYAKNGKSLQVGTVCQRHSHTIYQFGFGKNDGLKYKYIDERQNPDSKNPNLFSNNENEKLDEWIEKLSKDKISNSGAFYNKIIRIYKHKDGFDNIIFIKPNAVHYWLNSIALRDAGDTLIYLQKEGF